MKARNFVVTSAALAAAAFTTVSAQAQAEDSAVTYSNGGLLGEVGGEVSLGYTSRYVFRGDALGKDAVWGGLEVAIPLTEVVDLTLGGWYINPTSDEVIGDELDLYVNLSAEIMEGLEIGVGYVAYIYPEFDIDSSNEVGISIRQAIGEMFSVNAAYYYDFDLEINFTEVGIGFNCPVTGIEASARAGFYDEDYAYTTIDLERPIQLSENASLVPHVAAVFPEEDVFGNDDEEIFGGAAIRVNF